VNPLLVSYDELGLPNGIRWSHITTLLVNSIQEQQSEIDWLASSTPWLTGLNIGDPVDPTQLGFGDKSLVNVKAITSASGNWSIDEEGILVVKEVRADKLCLGSTCVDEAQLQELLNSGGISSPPPADPVEETPPPADDPPPADPVEETPPPADDPPPADPVEETPPPSV